MFRVERAASYGAAAVAPGILPPATLTEPFAIALPCVTEEIDARGAGIRAAQFTDLDALVALERHFPGDRLSRQSFRRLLQGSSAEVWVYEDGACVTGNVVLCYRRNSTRARLYSLVVHPGYQGRGIARTLLDSAERAAAQRGCRALSLEVRSDNAPALRLYRKAGFQLMRQIADYYHDHASALRLEKRVASSK